MLWGILLLLLSLSACGGNDSAANEQESGSSNNEDGSMGQAEEVTIRIGNFYAQDTTYGVAFDSLKEEIEEKSNGTITVDIFHGGSLGSEQDHIQAVHEGSLEMMHSGTAGIGLYVPETAVFELWYNFQSLDQLQTAFEQLKPELGEMCEAEGFKLLGAYFDGPRNILSNKKVETIDQLQGLGFRVPDSTLYVSMAGALGTNAITMPYGDVYTSLQTGAIDAMEGTPDSVLQENFYEQASYYILDEHVYQPLSIIYNLDAWNNLSTEQQEIIETAVINASDYHLTLVKDANEQALSELEENGIELVEVTDSEKWREAVAEANQTFAEEQGEKGEMIYSVMQEVLSSQ